MVKISLFSATHFPTRPLFSHSNRPPFLFRLKPPPRSRLPVGKSGYFPLIDSSGAQDQWQQRTLFPGGYKRPEIKVSNLVLQLSPEDVLDGDGEEQKQVLLDAVDEAVSGRVGIVVLNFGEQGSGRKLYEAACLLKSVIRDRAYLLIAERVVVAAAVNTSGVVVSDQALLAIVARDTMMDSKSESVFLPLVARNVQSSDASVNASSSEGADFLIYNDVERNPQELARSVLGRVKIPIFVALELLDEEKLFNKISFLLKSGASGLVVSLQGLRLVGNDVLNALYNMHVSNRRTWEKMESSNKLTNMDVDNGSPIQNGLAGFVKLEDREGQFIETERLLLLEALSLIQRAAPLVIF